MFFILFLCYVTVGLAALQFNSPSVTLLNIILTYFMFNFYLQNPPHTPSTPSPTDSISGGGGGHVFADPFPNTRQATKVARETSVFFCFCFCFFLVFVFCFFVVFFYKGKTAFFEKRGSAVRNTPVDRGTITANPGINFNSSFFFFYSKAFSRIIFSIIFRHPIIR